MSKKTNTAEEKYDSYELEVLAIVNALKKFCVYLLRQPFKIVTDCSAFPKTMQKNLKQQQKTFVLTKLSLDDSTKWYKYVDRLQRVLNSTICRSTKWTPFELLVGTRMCNKEDILIKDLLLEEMVKELLEQREFVRNDAKKNIETLQSENRKTYNRRRKKASLYKEGDLVAIQRTQFGAGLKLRPKFLGPYKVTKGNFKDRYEVEKVGQHEGPNSTTTSADLMKPFFT
ncbi:transposon Ty3-G Gag-Pol polyprotein [Trichonephila clavipes]|nr:transposon Ty3-G Gag-Pol polyprotein [Trichonephila clavipes]